MAVGNNGERVGSPNKGFSGSTIREVDLLQAVGAKSPQKLDWLIEAWAAKRIGFTFSDFLDTKATVKEFENDNEFTWDIVNEVDPNVPLKYAIDEAGNEIEFGTDSMVGVQGKPFSLVFASKHFFDGDVILPELNEYNIEIISEPADDGTNVRYTARMIDGGQGIPSNLLMPGKLFSFGWSLREDEMSRKRGGIEFNTTSSMKSCWTKLRYDLKVSGNLLDNRVNIASGVKYTDTATGKNLVAEKGWIPAILANFNLKWKNMKTAVLLYGRSNKDENGEYKQFGKAGSLIKSAPGLFEQMSWGHQEYYSEPKALLRKIEDKLMALCEGRINFGDRQFVITTGERGAAIFSKSVEEISSGWSRYEYDAKDSGVMKKVAAKHVVNGQQAMQAAKPVFTEYVFGGSIKVTVVVDNSYSGYGVNSKITHPDGGPASSYRFDIFDLGSSSQPNIIKCKIKGKDDDWRSYGVGVRDVWHGNTNVNYAYTDEDSSFISYGWTGAVAVLDPTRCCSFIPNILDPSNI